MSSWAGEIEKEKRPAISGRTDIEDRHLIGVLRLQFVPEPSSWLMLVPGIGLLGVFYRRRVRDLQFR
jgi:hypothetical protein